MVYMKRFVAVVQFVQDSSVYLKLFHSSTNHRPGKPYIALLALLQYPELIPYYWDLDCTRVQCLSRGTCLFILAVMAMKAHTHLKTFVLNRKTCMQSSFVPLPASDDSHHFETARNQQRTPLFTMMNQVNFVRGPCSSTPPHLTPTTASRSPLAGKNMHTMLFLPFVKHYETLHRFTNGSMVCVHLLSSTYKRIICRWTWSTNYSNDCNMLRAVPADNHWSITRLSSTYANLNVKQMEAFFFSAIIFLICEVTSASYQHAKPQHANVAYIHLIQLIS